MTATFPTGVKSFSTKTDNVTTVHAVDVNDLQDEVTAIETALGASMGNIDIATKIHAATNKTTPVDADETGIVDSVSGLLNKVTWANIKATLKAYFDTLYLALVAPGTAGNVLTSNSSVWASAAAVEVKISANIILFGPSGLPSTTNGAGAAAQLETATNKVNFNLPPFVNGSKTYLEWDFIMPDDYGGGTITAQFFWTANSAVANSVVWGLAGRIYSAGDALDQAMGTSVEVTSANTAAAYSDNESPVSAAITFAGTPGAGKRVHIKAYRLGSGADNLASPALLDLIRLVYVRA